MSIYIYIYAYDGSCHLSRNICLDFGSVRRTVGEKQIVSYCLHMCVCACVYGACVCVCVCACVTVTGVYV